MAVRLDSVKGGDQIANVLGDVLVSSGSISAGTSLHTHGIPQNIWEAALPCGVSFAVRLAGEIRYGRRSLRPRSRKCPDRFVPVAPLPPFLLNAGETAHQGARLLLPNGKAARTANLHDGTFDSFDITR